MAEARFAPHRLRYAVGQRLVRIAVWLMQPVPVRTSEPSVHDLVVETCQRDPALRPLIPEIRARKELGLAKYGTLLQASNDRDHLLDGRQEGGDLVCYLRAAAERARAPGVRRERMRLYRDALSLLARVRAHHEGGR